MRWIWTLLLLLSSLLATPLEIAVGAKGALLMNAKTGAVLFEKNSRDPLYPASTTKIATALYALHLCGDDLERRCTASRNAIATITPEAKRQSNYRSPPHWLETDGGHIGIKKGEEFGLYDLLCAHLIASANDASNVIAENLGGAGGEIPKFMEGVNRYLKEIGCTHTHYNNPHGLHHPEHTTTPHDLALMARKGLENPVFKEIVGSVRYTIPQTNLEYERNLLQTNRLLRSGKYHYPQAFGVKTGTTQAAGKNLVAAAMDGDRELIAVAMGYSGGMSELYADITMMFETAFQEQKMRRYLLPKGGQKLTTKVRGGRGKLKTYLPEGLYFDFYPSEEGPTKATVCWELPQLPISKGDQVALLKVVDGQGSILNEVPLLALEEMRPTVLRRVLGERGGRRVLFGLGVACLLFFFWKLRRKRTHRPLYR